MHIQVITGEGQDGATQQLRSVRELMKWFGMPTKPIYAEAYDAAGLLQVLELRAAVGIQREILVLGCSREQIQAVLEWQYDTDEQAQLEDLVIHLVWKISSLKDAG
jgi:hypothetical protein